MSEQSYPLSDESVQSNKTLSTGKRGLVLICTCMFSLITFSLMLLYYLYSARYGWAAHTEIVYFLSAIFDSTPIVNHPVPLRILAFILLSFTSYGAVHFANRFADIGKSETTERKLLSSRFRVDAALTLWVIFLYSSAISYYELYLPEVKVDISAFSFNLIGAILGLLSIRLVSSIFQLIRRFARK